MSDLIRPDILVQQHAINLAREVFRLTCLLPLQQRFVLTAQLRRSIALVCNRFTAILCSDSKSAQKRSTALFIRDYAEIKTQLKMAQSLGYFKPEEMLNLEHHLNNILHFFKSNADFNNN